MKKSEQSPDSVRVSIPAISLPQDIYEAIAEIASFNELSVKAELVLTLKEAIRKKYKQKPKPRGRQPGLPSQAILDELAELKRAFFIDVKPDGTYVGVNAQSNGSGWRVTAPPVLSGHKYVYLGTYRTQEEAAVVRGRAIREQKKEELIAWKYEDDKLQQMMDYYEDNDPNNAVPLRAPPASYRPTIMVESIRIPADAELDVPIEPLSGEELEKLTEPAMPLPDPEAGKWS